MRVAFAILSLFAGLYAEAATFTAASSAYADVATAYASCATNDVLSIPAGSNNWSSTLSVVIPVSIIGAGSNSTILNGGGSTVLLDIYVPGVRVSQIQFVGTVDSGGSSIRILGTNAFGDPAGGNEITCFRVDHCHFRGGAAVIWCGGYSQGVIDHCTFWNPQIATQISGDNAYSWARPTVPGTTNCVVIEDCSYFIDQDVSGQELWYHQHGARSTVRHCTGGASISHSGFYDSHGNTPGADPSPYGPDALYYRGQPLLEYYYNDLTSVSICRYMYIRGGSVLVWSNQFHSLDNYQFLGAIKLTEEENSVTAFWNPLRTNYPAGDQITNSYFFSNVVDTIVLTNIVLTTIPEDELYIQEGRDYWMCLPQNTNVYYPYVPLVYPHPLVTAQDGPAATTIGTVRAQILRQL